MNERCQAENVMLRRTLRDVAAPIPAAHARGTVAIAFTITGNTRSFLGAYSQRMLRGPLTDP